MLWSATTIGMCLMSVWMAVAKSISWISGSSSTSISVPRSRVTWISSFWVMA